MARFRPVHRPLTATSHYLHSMRADAPRTTVDFCSQSATINRRLQAKPCAGLDAPLIDRRPRRERLEKYACGVGHIFAMCRSVALPFPRTGMHRAHGADEVSVSQTPTDWRGFDTHRCGSTPTRPGEARSERNPLRPGRFGSSGHSLRGRPKLGLPALTGWPGNLAATDSSPDADQDTHDRHRDQRRGTADQPRLRRKPPPLIALPARFRDRKD